MSKNRKDRRIQVKHMRIRKKVIGTPERPRLSLHRSHLNLTVQVIDDYAENTLVGASTASTAFRSGKGKQFGNIKGAEAFGVFFAGLLKEKNIKSVVFDRGGWPYHGRVKAFAETLRKNGIEF